MSRAGLYLKAWIFRFFQTIGRYCDLYLSTPLPLKPSFTITIPSTIGSVPGSFELLLYAQKGYKEGLGKSTEKYPLLINFHGGGYTIGHVGTPSLGVRRRALRNLSHRPHRRRRGQRELPPGASTPLPNRNQRLRLRNPLPLGALHLSKLDISRTSLSGFSAGGKFCFAASSLLHSELETSLSEGRIKEEARGKIVSIAAFYPAVDWTKPRSERNASNPNAKPLVPWFLRLFSAFEDSYLFPLPDMYSPLLSPGLAPDELLKEALAQNLIIVTCWSDGLLVEGEKFRKRLQDLGKRVDGEMVEGVPHGWDKWPTWWRGIAKRDTVYKSTAESLKEFWS